ncbi:acetylxylan esterase [Sinomonas gamaensis]|jgi:cephalosporin-C deacetylase|uniref:acetylxylan esterase n=1 Tax=Sinomonas gamaensis TaxID=2565624 RepID=UPI001109AE02|nr:acetylxylan esterase [Sinomonas gamaensis]
MPAIDLPLAELRAYRGSSPLPADLDAFWSETIDEARSHPLSPRFDRVETHLPLIETYDVTFAGYGGDPIKAWLHLPAAQPSAAAGGQLEALPAVVHYLGYSGGRGLPHQNTIWAQAGYAMLVMDSRGQGYGGQLGETPDPHPSAGGVSFPGLMTRGILDRRTYYFRRLFTDALRAIEAVQAHPRVDASRVVVQGVSQGGALSVAAAGLAAGRVDGVIACLPDVNFLADYSRALDVATTGPYPELENYLKRHRGEVEAAFATLPYFDVVNLARAARVPAYFSVALRDTTCPPSTVYATYNNYGESSPVPVEKSIEEYPFNNHEGGGEHHVARQLAWMRKLLP